MHWNVPHALQILIRKLNFVLLSSSQTAPMKNVIRTNNVQDKIDTVSPCDENHTTAKSAYKEVAGNRSLYT